MNKLGPAKGSRLFSNDKKSLVKLVTMALLSLGVIAASVFTYQQLTKSPTPSLISMDDAIRKAIFAGNWNEQTLRDKTIEATLMHVKANGFSFVVDEKTLQDSPTIYHNLFPKYENQYVWEIQIIAPNNNDWVYIINAEKGEVLLQPPYQ
jgi:hypothetical protein